MTKGFCGSCELPWDEPPSFLCEVPDFHGRDWMGEIMEGEKNPMQETLPVKIMIWAFVIVCLWVAGLGLYALTQWVVRATGGMG